MLLEEFRLLYTEKESLGSSPELENLRGRLSLAPLPPSPWTLSRIFTIYENERDIVEERSVNITSVTRPMDLGVKESQKEEPTDWTEEVENAEK